MDDGNSDEENDSVNKKEGYDDDKEGVISHDQQSSNVEHTSLHEGSHSVENSISNDHRKGESGDVLADIAKTTTESLQSKPLELHPGEDDDSKRFKRKAKWRNLSARNEELESLRPVYLRRIAELEQEVDAYRMAGAINLQKENELFRVEIFKHKAFLANVTQAIQDTTRSQQATNSEHLRLITEVINSSISRIVGLVHMSTQWQRFDEIDHESGLKMAVSLEFLPHGVLPRESKRINMRYEILHAPVSADNLHQILMSFWGNQDKVRSLYSAFDVSSTYRVNYIPMESPSLDEARKSLGGDTIQLIRFNEESARGIVTDSLYTTCTSSRDLVPQSFVACGNDEALKEEINSTIDPGIANCQIFASISDDDTKSLAEVDIESTLTGKFSFGHVVVPTHHAKDLSHSIMIFSVPMGSFEAMRDTSDVLQDGGGLRGTFSAAFHGHMEIFAQEILSFTENAAATA